MRPSRTVRSTFARAACAVASTTAVLGAVVALPSSAAHAVDTGSISGTIASSDGQGAQVRVLEQQSDGSWLQLKAPWKDDGAYTIGNIPVGNVEIEFFDDAGYSDVGPTWYPNATEEADATPIAVTAGQTMSGVDFDHDAFVAANFGSISATTSGADAGSDMAILDATTGEVVNGPAGGSADYLPPGTYVVAFARYPYWGDDQDTNIRAEAQYYDGTPEGSGFGAAKRITVAAGQHIDIEASLREGGTISMTAVDGGGQSVPCEVVAYDPRGTVGDDWVDMGLPAAGPTGTQHLATANTERYGFGTGALHVSGLTSAGYKLDLLGCNGRYTSGPRAGQSRQQWYDADSATKVTSDPTKATVVSAAPGTTVSLGKVVVKDPGAVPATFYSDFGNAIGWNAARTMLRVPPTTLTTAGRDAGAHVSYSWTVDGTAVGSGPSIAYRTAWNGQQLKLLTTVTAEGYTTARHTLSRTVSTPLVPDVYFHGFGTPILWNAAHTRLHVPPTTLTSAGKAGGAAVHYRWTVGGKTVGWTSSVSYHRAWHGQRIRCRIRVTAPKHLARDRNLYRQL